MVKKILVYILLMTLVLAMLVPTLAWFANFVPILIEMGGAWTANDSFFESGDGSVDNPYVISEPVHVYNLAWLQYIGYFNGNEKANNGRAQSYFVLKKSIDMDGLVIPPIGTTEYPFIGNFDGQGYVISNFTTANAEAALKQRPTNAQFNNTNQTLLTYYDSTKTTEAGNVIGFFGVVGKYEPTNTMPYLAGAVLDEGDPPTTENTSDEEKNANTVYMKAITAMNVGLHDYELQTSSANTTVGIFAGYVNAHVETVALSQCTVTAKQTAAHLAATTNVSDYTLVGFCEDAYKNVLNEVHTVIFNPTETDDGKHVIQNNTGDGTASGWGGSIAMDTLYTNLSTVYNSSSEARAYTYRITKTVSADYPYSAVYSDPESFPVSTTGSGGGGWWSGGSETIYYFKLSTISNGQFAVTFYDNESSDRYRYISGGTLVNRIKYTYTDENVTAYMIGYNGNYLNLSDDGQSVITGTEATTATKWILDDSNLYAVYNGFRVYLDVEDSALVINNNEDTTHTSWTLESGGTNIRCSSGYLVYEDNEWSFASRLNETGYTISSNGNYLSASGTTLTNETSADEATLWTLGDYPLNGDTIAYTYNNQTYYLHRSGSQPLGLSNYSSTNWTQDSNYIHSGNYYIYLNGTTWTTTTTQSQRTELELNYVTRTNTPATLTATAAKGLNVTKDTLMEYDANGQSDATYIPLQMSASHEAEIGNTGYITSGIYNVLAQGNTPGNQSADRLGDIRVSQYNTSNINNEDVVRIITKTGNTYKFSTIPVVTENNVDSLNQNATYTSANLQKYADCVGKYYNLVNASSENLYGLHFMNAHINIESLVTIPTAKINGKTYSNYQVPGDCIDFNLKERGYINFFAGTYYKGNDSFFSLHHIIREADGAANDGVIDGPAITSIKEINKIYGIPGDSAASYIYEYVGESGIYYVFDQSTKTYTPSNSLPQKYEMVFDLNWIKNPDEISEWSGYSGGNGEAYYFEVPVNEGEYALGSVDGGTGAYLLYLDISANAQENQRTIIYEKIEETNNTYYYANGVYVKELDGVTTPLTSPLEEQTAGEAFAITLKSGYSGSVIIDRSDTGINYGDSSADQDTVVLSMANNVTVTKNSSNASPPVPASSKKTTILRVVMIDTNVTTGEVTMYVFSKIEDPEGTVTYKAEKADDSGTLVEDNTLIGNTSDNVTTIETTKKEDSINWSTVDKATSTTAVEYNITYSDKTETAVVNNQVVLNHATLSEADPPVSTYSITVGVDSQIPLVVKVISVGTGENDDENIVAISYVTVNGEVVTTDETVNVNATTEP